MCFAVTRLGESFSAHRASERLLPRVHSLMTDEFVKFTERLHAVGTLMRHLRFLCVCVFVPLQLRRPVEHLSTVGTGVLVSPTVAILVSDQLLQLCKTLLAMLTLVKTLRLPRVYGFMPL